MGWKAPGQWKRPDKEKRTCKEKDCVIRGETQNFQYNITLEIETSPRK